jgi:hypothetical protein
MHDGGEVRWARLRRPATVPQAGTSDISPSTLSPAVQTLKRCFEYCIEPGIAVRECGLTCVVSGDWMTVEAASGLSLFSSALGDASDRRQTVEGVLSDCNDFPRRIAWRYIMPK